MEVGFVTCVELGLSCMEAIYEVGGTLEVVVSLMDNLEVHKSGRVYVDEFCGKNDLRLLKVDHVND